MATPTIREAVSAAASGASATVNTGAGTAIDDVLVCFFGNDFDQAANMGAPTGTAGTWTLQATGDDGTNSAHLKVYTRPVTVGGAQTVTVSPTPSNEEVYNSTIVLVGADTSSPADGAAGGNGAASTSHIAPSVSPATSDALLLCGAQSVAGGAASSYTPPSGMTERTDVTDGVFAAESVASLVLSSSGATGTKTFTFSPTAQAYATASIAVKGASGVSGSPPPTLPPWLLFELIGRAQQQYATLSTPTAADTGTVTVGLAASATAAKVSTPTGTTPVGLSANGPAKKVAVVTGLATIGVAATGAARKVSADTGIAALGLVANAIHVPTAADTGLAELGLAATATARKIVVASCVATVGLSSASTAKKVSKDTGIGVVGLAATDAVQKVSKDTGTAAFGLAANFIHVPQTADTGLATVGLIANATSKKIVVAVCRANVGLASAATAKKVAKTVQTAALGMCGTDTVKKVTRPTLISYVGVVGRYAGLDFRSVVARSVIGLRTQHHQCITYRSFIGTTLYDLTTTARPFTGTTSDPC